MDEIVLRPSYHYENFYVGKAFVYQNSPLSFFHTYL